MKNKSAFTYTKPELLAILEDLVKLEPIFHTPEFGTSAEDVETRTAPDYWEVGASGRRYSREFIMNTLRDKPPVIAATLGWKSFDHAVSQLGTETYLLTYVLLQGRRLTRRATIWERFSGRWRVRYHQGTEVSVQADDAPSS
jgi:hypothetical protein